MKAAQMKTLDGKCNVKEKHLEIFEENNQSMILLKGYEGKLSNNSVIPIELLPAGKYVKQTPINFREDFFDLIDPDRPVSFNFSSDVEKICFNAGTNSVEIADCGRLKNSVWFREAIIYHEFGHAIDVQRGLSLNHEISNLINKHQTLLNRKSYRDIWAMDYCFKSLKFIPIRKKILISDLAYIDYRLDNLKMRIWRIGESTFLKSGISKYDLLEQINKVKDTLMAIDNNYGEGHLKSYYNIPGRREAELIAHAFENKFASNKIFEKYLPDLYWEMINYIDKIE